MGNFWWLAHESAALESGFGLNLDIFETNIVNLFIVIGVLVYFGRNVLGKILAERRETIASTIASAEKRQKDAAAALTEKQQQLAQAQAEANRIRAEAETKSEIAKEVILAQAKKDIERLQAEAVQDLTAAQERAIAELRQRVTAMALQNVENQLKTQLDEGKQQKLIDRRIALLGGG